MPRLRDCAPVPHVSEHAVHAVQVDSAQSIGHSEALQLRESETAAHVTPPWEGEVATERVRAWLPPPHEAEHAVQSVYEVNTQSTGQLCVSQLCVSARKGHTSPPCIGVFSIFERVRV